MTDEFLKKVANVGTITVAFQLCSSVRPRPTPHSAKLRCVDDLGIVSEKAMKGDMKDHKAS